MKSIVKLNNIPIDLEVFTLTADVGSVDPSLVARYALLHGIMVETDDNAKVIMASSKDTIMIVDLSSAYTSNNGGCGCGK
jgi:hypothetical protein